MGRWVLFHSRATVGQPRSRLALFLGVPVFSPGAIDTRRKPGPAYGANWIRLHDFGVLCALSFLYPFLEGSKLATRSSSPLGNDVVSRALRLGVSIVGVIAWFGDGVSTA